MNEKMTKKQKVVFAVVAAVIVLGIIMSYIFLMKNQHIDSIPEEKKMPAMSDTEDYEVRESDESIQSSETEDYYMTSTGVTAEEQFAEEIKNDILKHDWDALSEKISYPIVINGTTVTNREDFLKLDIDGKLNQEFVEAIRAETCRKMFCNWQGVMMGDAGQIWFGNVDNGTGTSELSIIGINNMLETESENLNAEETIEPDPKTADGSVDELSMDEIEELLFADGSSIGIAEARQLIQAMNAFAPETSSRTDENGSLSVTDDYIGNLACGLPEKDFKNAV